MAVVASGTSQYGGYASASQQRSELVKAIEAAKAQYGKFFETKTGQLSAERQVSLVEAQTRTRQEFTGQSEDIIKFAQTANLNLFRLGQAVEDTSTANKILSEKLDLERKLREKGQTTSTTGTSVPITNKAKEAIDKVALQVGVGSGVIVASVAGLLFYFLVVRRK